MLKDKQIIIRISDANERKNRANAIHVALFVEELLDEQGSTITYGEGRWKGSMEHSASIEVITSAIVTEYTPNRILEFVRSLGQETAFITVSDVEAYV